MLVAYFTKFLKVSLMRNNQSAIGGKGFDDDRGNLTLGPGKGITNRPGIIVRKHNGFLSQTFGDAGAVGVSKSEGTRSRLHQQAVDVPVVAPCEFDDFVAPGETPGQANGRHGGLGSTVAHSHFLHRRNEVNDQFRHFHFRRSGRSETGSPFQSLRHRFTDLGVIVSVNRRSPSANVIQ